MPKTGSLDFATKVRPLSDSACVICAHTARTNPVDKPLAVAEYLSKLYRTLGKAFPTWRTHRSHSGVA